MLPSLRVRMPRAHTCPPWQHRPLTAQKRGQLGPLPLLKQESICTRCPGVGRREQGKEGRDCPLQGEHGPGSGLCTYRRRLCCAEPIRGAFRGFCWKQPEELARAERQEGRAQPASHRRVRLTGLLSELQPPQGLLLEVPTAMPFPNGRELRDWHQVMSRASLSGQCCPQGLRTPDPESPTSHNPQRFPLAPPPSAFSPFLAAPLQEPIRVGRRSSEWLGAVREHFAPLPPHK